MKPEQILVVDDEQRIVDSIAKCLTGEGFRVFCANDGLQALAMFETRKYDLVLMDLSMPGMDGFSVIRHIRDEQKNSNIRILVVSALADQQLDHAIAIGADAVLSKPFSNTQLRKTISEWVHPTVGI